MNETYNSKNPRHRLVRDTLSDYLNHTCHQDLYGGSIENSVQERAQLRRQCAADWANHSQIKPSDMPKWWRAGAFEPEAAQALIDAGVSVTLAKRLCKIKGEEIDTFAYHVSMGTMTVEQVVARIQN